MRKVIGYQAFIDVSCLSFEIADNLEIWMNIIRNAARKAKVKIINEIQKKFEPYGCSGVLLISESHIAFHTFPEYGSVHIDYYTCGTKENFEKGLSSLMEDIALLMKDCYGTCVKVKKVERVAELKEFYGAEE